MLKKATLTGSMRQKVRHKDSKCKGISKFANVIAEYFSYFSRLDIRGLMSGQTPADHTGFV